MPLLSDSYLQLDIGTSADLWQNETKDRAIGIDFGTFSLLERSSGFKFRFTPLTICSESMQHGKSPLKTAECPSMNLLHE